MILIKFLLIFKWLFLCFYWEETMKIHYKLYKSGKLLVTAAIFGFMLFGIDQTVNADTTTLNSAQTVSLQTESSSAKNNNSNSAQLIQSTEENESNIENSTYGTKMQFVSANSVTSLNEENTSPQNTMSVSDKSTDVKDSEQENTSVKLNEKSGEKEENGYWYYYLSNGEKAIGFQKLTDGRIVYYNEEGQMQNGLTKANDGYTYYLSPINGNMYRGELQLNDHWYYFLPANGRMATGFQKLADGRIVYYNEDGQLQNGLTKASDGYTYYFSETNGNMYRGELQLNGHWYYFLPANGRMATGFQKLADGRIVYYNEEGQIQNGLTKASDGYTYYLSPVNGNMHRGELQLNGHWYYFLPANGRMATGFQKLADGRIVYYNEEGQMQNGDVQITNGDWYYFDPANGNMAKGGLLLDKVSGTLKYFNNNGVRQSGVISIDGVNYTFDSKTGSLNITGAGEHKIGNHWYLMNNQNKLVTGFQKLADGRIVYYDPINAQLVNGERQIDGDWYYFNPSNGNMTIGFQKLPDGRIVYYNSQGRLQLGEQKIDGDWYYFNPSNGNMTIGFQVLPDGRTVYYNSQGRMVHGWFNANGSWGDWNVHYADYSNGQVHSMNYYSQFTPIYAPEGCGAASLGMLLSGEGKYPGLRTLYNNLPQYGGVYSSANFRGPVTPDALASFGRNWDSNLQSVSGRSINQLADLVASGHPVLYYGWSLYEGAYQGKGNHIKVMLGYHNGYFHIYDPCYNSYWEGSHHYGNFDYGANSWQSIVKVASEYRGWAVSSL